MSEKTSVAIDSELHKEAKTFTNAQGIKFGWFVECALRYWLALSKKNLKPEKK
jgi:hypothetical protein